MVTTAGAPGAPGMQDQSGEYREQIKANLETLRAGLPTGELRNKFVDELQPAIDAGVEPTALLELAQSLERKLWLEHEPKEPFDWSQFRRSADTSAEPLSAPALSPQSRSRPRPRGGGRPRAAAARSSARSGDSGSDDDLAPSRRRRSSRHNRALRRRLWALDPSCWICGEYFESLEQTTLDHLVPLASGGSNAAWNLALAHASCNGERGVTPVRDMPPRAHRPREVRS